MLRSKEDFESVVCGGTVRKRDMAVVGQTTTDFVGHFSVDYAILGVVAIALDGSILDFSVDEAALTQAIIRCGRNTFVLADNTKSGRHAMAKVAHLSRFTALFTDALPGTHRRERLFDSGATLRIVT